MKVSPYLVFNGNCLEAIKLYERAFNTKANYCQYKDAPPSENYPIQPGTEELIMHAVLPIGQGTIYLCDTTPDTRVVFGNGSFACVELDSAESVKAAFDVLKVGGRVFCEAQETFWNKCYAELEDKFGLKWSIMIEDCTCSDECASGYNPNCTCTYSGCHCREMPSPR
jgi:PhnB protein